MLCNTGVGVKIQKYYENFVGSSNIKVIFNMNADHTFVRLFVELSYIKQLAHGNCDGLQLKRRPI